MNDFKKEGGGTIRMLGILNELASQGKEVIFISNAENKKLFHRDIEHISVGRVFNSNDKRKFQLLLSLMPAKIVNNAFKSFLDMLKNKFDNEANLNSIYFFEYLDNSIGYWLKANGVINGYINDIHGVATLEFSFQAKYAERIWEKIIFKFKTYISSMLDSKVFNNADGLIFASKSMQDYFYGIYPKLKKRNNIILPYVLNETHLPDPDLVLQRRIKTEHKILENEKVFLFAGAFKKTGGVPDLISAFHLLMPRLKNIKLLIIGDGPTYKECEDLIEKNNSKDKVVLLGRKPYHELTTYQSIADVLICPDRQNVYSQMIIHVKYLDALASGKLVINGSFDSVMEINENDKLSLSFTPSDVKSLANVMEGSINDHANLVEKYRGTRKYTLENLTYKSCIFNIIDQLNPEK